jgi:hypothetical protein
MDKLAKIGGRRSSDALFMMPHNWARGNSPLHQPIFILLLSQLRWNGERPGKSLPLECKIVLIKFVELFDIFTVGKVYLSS